MQSSSTASLRFKKLADNLCTLNKISCKIVDNAEFEYDLFEIAAVKKYSEVFLTCDPIFSYQDARKKEKAVCVS